jgi:hypothetical protein
MKCLLTYIFLLNLIISFAQQIISFYPSGWTDVKRYEKLEIGITLPTQIDQQIEDFLNGNAGINPYDFNQIIIDANFTINERTYHREGFYYRDIHIDSIDNTFSPSKSNYPFRLRFAPPQIGNYSVELKLKLGEQIVFNALASFNVVESTHRGFISLGNSYHLKADDGNNFIAIGQNIPFCDYPKATIRPSAFNRQRDYIRQLADNSGNFVRIRLDPWSNEIELEEAGVYGSKRTQGENFERQWHAYELDKTFDLAQNRNLYYFITLLGDYHFSLSSDIPLGWAKNPYNKLISNSNDFFDTNSNAYPIYTNKVRYLMARYGYSPNLAVIGIINETDNVENYKSNSAFRSQINNWVKSIGAYLKQDNVYPQHLLTNGYATAPSKPDEGIDNNIFFDIITVNQYSNSRRTIKNRHNDYINKLLSSPKSTKPFIYSEIGTGLCVPTHEDWFSDADFHNTIWSTSMNHRAFGNGLYWWDWEQESHLVPEDKSIAGINHRINFKALSAFFNQLAPPFESDEFTSRWDCDANILNRLETRKVEWIENVNKFGSKGFGWVHNSDYYWINDPLKLTTANCPTCIYGGMEFFYDSDCYQEKESSIRELNEPKGPFDFGKKHEEITLNGYKPIRNYKIEIWSCYGDGGLVTTLNETSNLFGQIKFKRNVGRYPNDADFGDPDFAYKIHLSNESFEELVNIYPNPFQDKFTIDGKEDITQIIIYNSLGIEIKNVKIAPTKKLICDLFQDQPSDIYIINIVMSNQYVNYDKLIKL